MVRGFFELGTTVLLETPNWCFPLFSLCFRLSMATVEHFDVASGHTEVPPAVESAGDEGDGWGTGGWG